MVGMTCVAIAMLVLADSNADAAAKVQPAIEAILAVSSEGNGSSQAADAWRTLSKQSPDQIPQLLSALDRANPIAANWILSAIDAIAERSADPKINLPADALNAFLLDSSHSPRARRIAFELLAQVGPETTQKLVPNFLQDSSPELRRDAVDYWTKQAESAFKNGNEDEAKSLFQKALTGAVDQDQVDQLAKRLSDMGHPIDKTAHYGLILDWKIVGPFDNTDEKGYFIAYPPEENVEFEAKYDGKNGQVQWIEHVSDDPMGRIDLNKALVDAQGVVAYAATQFTLDEPRTAQIRFGTPNGWKLWVNGEFIFGREEYHSGESFDQHVYDVDLKQGENLILFKCCQNEQTEDWAKDWRFQLRVCEPAGSAILSTTRPTSPAKTQTAQGGQ